MLVIFHPDATEAEIAAVTERILATGAGAQRVVGAEQTVIGVIDGDRDHLTSLELDADAGVDRVVPVSSPYKLAHKHRHGDRPHPVDDRGGVASAGESPEFRLILGPCAVESDGADAERRRARVPTRARTCCAAAPSSRGRRPYAFQGLGVEGLKILAEARAETGLPIVTELTDLRDIDAVVEYADCVQVGARNMQHFPLLTELGRSRAAGAAQARDGGVDRRLPAGGRVHPDARATRGCVLCERGIHAKATPARSCLDLAAVTVLKEHTHLPVIVDPSHAAGRRALVEPLALAAAACGADGLIVECHPNPSQARCDGPQAITVDALDTFCARVRSVARAAAFAVA